MALRLPASFARISVSARTSAQTPESSYPAETRRNRVRLPLLGLGMLAALSVLINSPAIAAAAPSDPETTQAFSRVVARHSGKCLDVPGSNPSQGVQLIQWTCHGGDNQSWVIVPSGEDRVFIISRSSGHCVDVSGASQSNGAAVIQWPCHGGANQQWIRRNAGGGYSFLVARHSGQCLDVSGASQANGARIIQWPCHGGGNQQWRI
jgi:hypothetical protein